MRLSSVLYAAFALAAQAQELSDDEKGVQLPAEAPRPDASTRHGCWKSESSSWKQYTISPMSSGACIDECRDNRKTEVAALGGEYCYCGNKYPPRDDKVSDSNCDYPCPQYPQEACGGIDKGDFWSVFNTGLQVRVEYDEAEDSESSTTSTSTTAAPTTSQTDTQQQSSEPSPSDDSDNNEEEPQSSNMGAIIGGVVGAVGGVALLIGVGFWWLRRRRNRSIEEEHRRNAAVNSFIAGSKPPGSSGGISMTDSRMDPGLAHRRMSDGSIADNQDYSRKILRVTNA